MEELNINHQKSHKLNMTDRKNCLISGVQDVLSFDVNEILLETEQGMLMVKGKELHVSRLTLEKGEVDITGMVDSLTYSEAGNQGIKRESLISRLFK
ncbi:MAG: sporulation protein YabP [Lachnospiraceae bacterium]|nr:sporulation protein YabP [Lachnospiraceae bacterium]